MIERLKNLPDTPGVYQYFDKEGRLLYVGKAKSLKKRVKSYFRFTPTLAPAPNLGPRIYQMIAQAARIKTIVTPTESDALLLENSLIKQLKPKYNILLRDDKTYPYIYIDMSEPFPRFELTRKVVRGRKVKYFGPFPHGARAILDSLYELVPLVQKKGCLKGKKACLFHQIGRCEAPCEGKIDETAYKTLIKEALSYIHNRQKIKKALERRMQQYAQSLRFEEAAQIRDRIDAIDKIEEFSSADLAKLEDLDIFAVDFGEEGGVLVRLFMREGKIVASSHTWLNLHDESDIGEVYRRSILEFYSAETPFTARAILTAHPFEEQEELAALLAKRLGKKVAIATPRRGDKKRLVALGMQNAKELLRQKRDRPKSDVSEQIRDLLDLAEPPERIEIFDNSHLAGKAPVGAMVVFNGGKWEKSSYRHYNLAAKDEYHQMEEMLTQRIASFKKSPPPDLWVIDGGETLRALASGLLKKFGTNLPVVGIAKEKIDAKAHRAKGSARDLLYTEKGAMRLMPSDRRLQWFQRLRDEAHRFAIAYHKKQRLKEDKKISLLEARGIGPAKVKRLIDYFSSFEAIREADMQTLAKVLNKTDAVSIIRYLQNAREKEQD
ncbi:excinuclease ABC subunit UvrC [Hydrogenimonas urashimensis]|uniref:excinuclease ABC subunit UvrC n=1 Tax=Hydrogenimonas urashimensis TaxID=2740515 RepID=UPI0019165D7F|nr:excinuclease ABC subunit UvrC [Hydrogenimonas urashimensis]